METMTLTINLPKDVGTALENKAKLSGRDAAEFVEDLVIKQIKRPTFRELFADVRENIAISDEDLEKEIDAAIKESRQARREKWVQFPSRFLIAAFFCKVCCPISGPAAACLELIEQDRIRLVVSEDILAEIKDVLSRPFLREKHPNLTDEKVENLIEILLEKAEFVEKVPEPLLANQSAL